MMKTRLTREMMKMTIKHMLLLYCNQTLMCELIRQPINEKIQQKSHIHAEKKQNISAPCSVYFHIHVHSRVYN